MELSPLCFESKLFPKIWGGQRLGSWGKPLPGHAGVGESWEIYDRPEGSGIVAQGPLKGKNLSQLMAEFGPRLLGEAEFEKGHPSFPLMLKLIDASDSLSVQVHPNDEQALRLVGPKEMGKTEAWLVLEALPGSKVVAGLKKGTSRESFLAALKAGKLESVLNEFEVKPGDLIFLPAGRLHAIGKGCLVAEIQQNSDTTYRVYDYQRLENGKPRELHLNQALECIRFDDEGPASDPKPPAAKKLEGGQAQSLALCPYFRMERWSLSSKQRLQGGTFQILLGLKGEGRLESAQGGADLGPGSCLLLPACLDAVLEPKKGPLELLWARP